jgi:hypothetical protein
MSFSYRFSPSALMRLGRSVLSVQHGEAERGGARLVRHHASPIPYGEAKYTSRGVEENMNDVTVADILDAPRASNYVTAVRSLAPAVVLILEKDAPARMQFLRTTEDEEDTLAEWARGDQLAGRVLSAYFGDDDDDSERWEREEAYTLRMASPVVAVGA